MKYTKIATSIDTEMYIQNELIPKILKIIEIIFFEIRTNIFK